MTARVEGALAGIVVADFSRVLAAPYATMLLGDLGADVIKVERPGVGDDTRAWGPPFAGGEATYFLSVNRNKRSFTADLSDEADREELTELIQRADVLIENFRPGTMARHGLSYEQVRELNPRLVYCSITGFGTGKGAAALPGYDLLVQAVGGLMSVTGPHPGEPVKAGVAHRASWATGVHRSRPYQLFPASDRPVVVAVGTDRQFASFCSGLGVPELAGDPRFGTNPGWVAHIDALDEIVSARMATRPADHWFTVLSALGVPCGPVNDIANAFELAANPVELSDTPPADRRRPPRLGEHTDELRAWLRDRPSKPDVVTATSASSSVPFHGSLS